MESGNVEHYPNSAASDQTRSARVLAVGDIVGEEAAGWLADRLPALRRELEVSWVIANAENCAVTGPSPMTGFGMTIDLVETLIDAGVDAITGGNHSWDGPEVAKVLDHPRVVRPANLTETRGRGVLNLRNADGAELCVINLLSPTAVLPDMTAPQPQPLWPAWQRLISTHDLAAVTIVDLHGESAWEKAAMASAVDGSVAAVVGTHTHDPTLRGHVLPGGTGYVAELGMTGRLGFTGGGFDPIHFTTAFTQQPLHDLPAFELATGQMVLGAVLLEIDPHGATTAVTRIA